MFRKSLFLGLTLMLGVVLVWLILRARKEEARAVAAPAEIVRKAKSSPTRALWPGDLDASQSRAQLGAARKNAEGKGARTARLDLVVRNTGATAYSDPALRLEWIGAGGATVGAETRVVPGTIQPGQALTVGGIVVGGVPEDAVRCNVSVLHADLAAGSAK
jgi:hypothetical protein